MKTKLYPAEQFPLTAKWEPLVHKIASENGFDAEEGIQEALVIEWDTKVKNCVLGSSKLVNGKMIIVDEEFQSNFFKQVLHQKLYLLNKGSYDKRRVSDVVVADDGSESSLIDTIIQARPFEKVYYQEMLLEIQSILMNLDALAAEMFQLRMTTGLRWKILKLQKFSNVSHNRFYSGVKTIKETVKTWVENSRGMPVGVGCLS